MSERACDASSSGKSESSEVLSHVGEVGDAFPEFDEEDNTRIPIRSITEQLPRPRVGDWVRFSLLDTSGSPVAGVDPREGLLQVGENGTGISDIHEYICQLKPGEAALFKDIRGGRGACRLALDELRPRDTLPSGSCLEQVKLSADQAWPGAGAVVFFRMSGIEKREVIPQDGMGNNDTICALRLMRVGSRARILSTTPAQDNTTEVTIEVRHIAFPEDVSILHDASLFKLSLESDSMELFMKPHFRDVVTAEIQGHAAKIACTQSWRWGYGDVSDEWEASVRFLGVGESAEIRRCADPSAPVEFTITLRDLQADDVQACGDTQKMEERCDVARLLFERGRNSLAWLHWEEVREACLPKARAPEPRSEEDKTLGRLCARAMGNLCVCAQYANIEPGRVLKMAQEARSISVRNEGAVPLWKAEVRIARSALKCGEWQMAQEHCIAANRTRPKDPNVAAQLRDLQMQLKSANQKSLEKEKEQCKRMFRSQ